MGKPRRRVKMICPAHSERLIRRETRYGYLWKCPADGCDVLCWGSDTSTPADQQTRDARNACHKAFDPLWRDERGPFCQGKRPNKRGVRRHRAYLWLSQQLGIDINDCHFGFFDADQCRRAMDAIETLAAGRLT